MLSVITIDEGDKWDDIVKSFRGYDVYYLSGYVRAFSLHGDGEPTLFYYDEGDFRAMNVVMVRDIASDPKFADRIPQRTFRDMTTPYGYGGFYTDGPLSGGAVSRLNEAYTEACLERGIVSEFVRFHPVLNNGPVLNGMYDVSELGKTIAMNLTSREQMWGEISSKNRNVIRKARKSGVTIYWGRNHELFTRFVDLYNATMDRDHARPYYYFDEEFYRSILEDLKYHSMIFYALYEGKIIAMSIVLFSNEQMHYHLSASDREHQHLAPTNLLLYEAACWGLENGYRTFHLGGGLGSREDNLYKFKKAFNRYSERTFAIGRKVFDKQKYEHLVQIRRPEVEPESIASFFPVYRA